MAKFKVTFMRTVKVLECVEREIEAATEDDAWDAACDAAVEFDNACPDDKREVPNGADDAFGEWTVEMVEAR